MLSMLKSEVLDQLTDFFRKIMMINRVYYQMMHPPFFAFGFTSPCKWFVEKWNSMDIFIMCFVKGLKGNIKTGMPKMNSSWVVQAVSWDTTNAGFQHFFTRPRNWTFISSITSKLYYVFATVTPHHPFQWFNSHLNKKLWLSKVFSVKL